jgi:hypothetical protein
MMLLQLRCLDHPVAAQIAFLRPQRDRHGSELKLFDNKMGCPVEGSPMLWQD